MPCSGLLSVVIPVYRSEAYLERTVSELVAELEVQGRFEVILVNDGSPDGVQDVIDRLCARDVRVRQVVLGRNSGQHRATLIGFSVARGDHVVTLDDDGQNPPATCLAVASELRRSGLDVVYGRFQVAQQRGLRRLASGVNRWLTRRTLGNSSGISISNVRALRGDLARLLGAAETPYPYIDAMLFRATSRIGEIPVGHRARESGESTYRLGTLLRLWVNHLTTLTILPLKIATIGSFTASIAGLLLGLVQWVRVMVERRAPAGWLSLFVAVTFLFSALFAFLGILGAYLGRMYVAQNQRGLTWIRVPRHSASNQAVGRETLGSREAGQQQQ